jgi:hypothetical protein
MNGLESALWCGFLVVLLFFALTPIIGALFHLPVLVVLLFLGFRIEEADDDGGGDGNEEMVGEGTFESSSSREAKREQRQTSASGMDRLESVLWYGSLAVLAVAVLLPPIGLHPVVRYALGATALVVLLFLMEGADGGGGKEEVIGEGTEFSSKEVKREQLKEEIMTKILHDAGNASRAAAGAVDVPPSRKDINKETDDGAARQNDNGGEDGINGDSDESREEDASSADKDNNTNTNNNNTWRCACENGFLPPGLLKNFGGAEAVMRMGMGQCYHKNGA